MRSGVIAAIAPSFVGRVGSSAVLEAVDEALAQLVAVGGHLGEPGEVRALWIACARRRVIDEVRSAECRHRGVAADDVALAGGRVDLAQVIEDARQWWRVQEILGVLRGDQRRWAEAWYDEVLSASRARVGQPRGLAEALGWTPAKTKCVSRRARSRMAAFIDARASGSVCVERQALLDAFILRGRDGGELVGGECRDAVLVHLAGCEECWAAWHTRRRALVGRCRAVVVVPLDVVAGVGDEVSEKLADLVAGACLQASSLLARVGLGGAAAAGGVATVGGKVTAACVGLACAAAAGGELVGVLPPIPREPVRELRTTTKPAERAGTAAAARGHGAATAASKATSRVKVAVRQAVAPPRSTGVRATRGHVPPAAAPMFSATSGSSEHSQPFTASSSGPPPAASSSAARQTPDPTTSGSPRPASAPPPASASPRFCASGSFGC
jgi:DNA-directed RNA polymerase specialized sigma24 family protein